MNPYNLPLSSTLDWLSLLSVLSLIIAPALALAGYISKVVIDTAKRTSVIEARLQEIDNKIDEIKEDVRVVKERIDACGIKPSR